jgi:serine protease inhibitor
MILHEFRTENFFLIFSPLPHKHNLDASSDKILDYFSAIMTQLNHQNKSYELDSANRIYVQENFQLLQSYKQILTNKFQGQFENIDFSNSKAAAQVNSFLPHKIKGVVGEKLIKIGGKIIRGTKKETFLPTLYNNII